MNKTELARKKGVARSTLYYKPKLPIKDEDLKNQILKVWFTDEMPAYGHKRLAIELKVNKKRVLRVMKIFKLKVPRIRGRKFKKPNDLGKLELNIPNRLKTADGSMVEILIPDFAWAQDFTYLWFAGCWWFVATVIDLFSREVMGFAFSKHHDKHLILEALNQALATGRSPKILHSDQGSEYQAYAYWDMIRAKGILASYSKKASPWQNGFQESFYSNFKLDLGQVSQLQNVGELIEAVYKTIHIYNTKKIHTSLKMSPKQYYLNYQLTHSATQETKEKMS